MQWFLSNSIGAIQYRTIGGIIDMFIFLVKSRGNISNYRVENPESYIKGLMVMSVTGLIIIFLIK